MFQNLAPGSLTVVSDFALSPSIVFALAHLIKTLHDIFFPSGSSDYGCLQLQYIGSAYFKENLNLSRLSAIVKVCHYVRIKFILSKVIH